MQKSELANQPLTRADVFFDAKQYLSRIITARDFIRERLPQGFTPQVVLTLGSGGLGEVANLFQHVTSIPYADIPGFKKTTVIGHAGDLLAGDIEGIPVLGFKGRTHYYEEGGQPNPVIALKNVTFPVYVARAVGAELYFATNAAGGLNAGYHPGDLMVISSHVDIHFPNPLAGSQVDFMNPMRFQPQHGEYDPNLRSLLHQAARNTGEADHVHEGVYCAVTGPTYESQADSQMLRSEGVDAVGMSTVPEIIVAANLHMDTLGFSLIANVIAADGTNATSHIEVQSALDDPRTKNRITRVTQEFFRLLSSSQHN